MKNLILLIFIAISVKVSAQATEAWTLKQCMSYALEHNVSIKQQEVQTEISNNTLVQSKFNRLPNLNGNANQNYNTGRSIDPFTNQFSNQTIQTNSFSLSTGLTVFAGNRLNNTIKMNEASFEASKASIEVTQNQISNAVVTAYLQIIMAEENLKIAKSQKELTQQQLDRAQKMVDAGVTNESATYTLQAQLANDQLQIINAENQIQLAYNSMINLLQLPIDEDFRIAQVELSSLPALPTDSPSNLYDIALTTMPEIKQSEFNMVRADYNQKIASSSYFPTVSAYANLNTVYSESGVKAVNQGFEVVPIGFVNSSMEEVSTVVQKVNIVEKPFSDQLSDNLGQSFGLSLQVPIFNGLSTKTAVENAKLNKQISTFNLEMTKNQLKSDITTAYTNLKAAKSSYDAAVISENAQANNYGFSEKRFDAGLMNSVDLLNAKNAWFQAQTQLVSAKYEYVFRKLIIDFYKGEPLQLN